MPSSLMYYKSKPKFIKKADWDGAGWYYHRGNGVYSKQSNSLDRKRGSGVGSGKYKHTHDKRKR